MINFWQKAILAENALPLSSAISERVSTDINLQSQGCKAKLLHEPTHGTEVSSQLSEVS